MPEKAEALRFSSFYIFSETNPVRIAVYNIIQHKVFEGFIILVIIVNSALLAIDDPTQENPHWADVLDIVFTAIFTTEMLLKMFALGVFMHKGSYLREGWNVLDFCIVILSYINFLPGFGNYTALRALRVMRPLRSMNAIPGLKVLVVALLKSVAALVHVMFLAAFIFAIFGILGVQLWNGTFRQRCINNSTGEANANEYCRPGASGDENWGHECAPGYRCSDWHNPGRGYLNFDNVLYAFLAVYQIATFESWGNIVYITYDVTGQISFLYFFVLILVVSYFIPNLILAVINNKFMQAQRHEMLNVSLKQERTCKSLEGAGCNERCVRSADQPDEARENPMGHAPVAASGGGDSDWCRFGCQFCQPSRHSSIFTTSPRYQLDASNRRARAPKQPTEARRRRHSLQRFRSLVGRFLEAGSSLHRDVVHQASRKDFRRSVLLMLISGDTNDAEVAHHKAGQLMRGAAQQEGAMTAAAAARGHH